MLAHSGVVFPLKTKSIMAEENCSSGGDGISSITAVAEKKSSNFFEDQQYTVLEECVPDLAFRNDVEIRSKAVVTEQPKDPSSSSLHYDLNQK